MCQDWVVFLRRQHVRSALGAAPVENFACRTARPQLLVTACRCAQVVLLSSVRSQFGAAWRIAGAALGCTTLACLLVIQRRAGSWQSDQQKERTLVDLVSVDTAFSLWASWTTIAAGCTIADAAAAVGGWDRRTNTTGRRRPLSTWTPSSSYPGHRELPRERRHHRHHPDALASR